MKNYKHFLLGGFASLIVVLTVGGQACNPPAPAPPVPPDKSAGLTGWVTDTAGAGIGGVTVTVGQSAKTAAGLSTATDATGLYNLTGLSPASDVRVDFTRDGYTANSYLTELLSNTISSANATLIVRQTSKLADAAIGGTATDLAGTTKVTFPAGSLVFTGGAKAGTRTTGEVNVSVTPLDITDEGDMAAFPGGFLAQSSTKEDGYDELETFALAEIVLDQNGASVGLAPGTTAALEIKMPSTKAAAGETIPLYYFDEALGVWVLSGEGVVQASSSGGGLSYYADIPHLSWWNADKPISQTDCVQGRVLDSAGNPVAGARICATGTSYNGNSFAYADSSGNFCVDIKRAGVVTLRVWPPGSWKNPILFENIQGPDSGVSCETGGCSNIGDLVMDYRSCIQGIVLKNGTEPLAGVTVLTDAGTQAVTNADGTFCVSAPKNTDVYVYAQDRPAILVRTGGEASCGAGNCVSVTLNLEFPTEDDFVGVIGAVFEKDWQSTPKVSNFTLNTVAQFATAMDSYWPQLLGFAADDLTALLVGVQDDVTISVQGSLPSTLATRSLMPKVAYTPMLALDPGHPGTLAALSQSALMYRRTELITKQSRADAAPWQYGNFVQIPELTFAEASLPDTLVYTWPGGNDISAFTATFGRPTVLSLTAPAITGTGVMAKIDVTQPLAVTWSTGKVANTAVLIILGATDVSGSAETSAYLVTRAVDDGSYTIPLSYMATLPNKSWKANSYTQTLLVARIRYENMQVPLVDGGNGHVWLNAWVLPVYGVYTESG